MTSTRWLLMGPVELLYVMVAVISYLPKHCNALRAELEWELLGNRNKSSEVRKKVHPVTEDAILF